MAQIHESLTALAVPVDDLTPDPRNARKHGARNLAAIEASLRAFGQRKPIVVQRVDDGLVVRAGNGTLAAAKALGWENIAAVVIDEDDTEATAFAIADNRTAELAEWDFRELAGLVGEYGVDSLAMGAYGWRDYELSPLLHAEWAPPEVDPGYRMPGNSTSGGVEAGAQDSDVPVRLDVAFVGGEVAALRRALHPDEPTAATILRALGSPE